MLKILHYKLGNRYGWYYRWHQSPHHAKVHYAVLLLYLMLIAGVVMNSIPQTRAAFNTKTWTTSADFASGTNSNIDTSNDQAKLASTTSNFTEDFSGTTYKGPGTTANWDTTNKKLTLIGDPVNGTTTNLVSKWTTAIGSTAQVNSILADPDTGFVYLGGANGAFAYYDPTSNSVTSLTSKISANWSTNNIYKMVYDPVNKYVYMIGYNKRLGAFKGGANPTSGTFVYLGGLLPGGAYTEAIGYDSNNQYLYYAGQSTSSGAFPAVANPATLTAGNFTALSGFSSGGMVHAMTFDPTNSIMYASGNGGTLEAFNTSSNPASGSWTNLSSKISADFSSASSAEIGGLALDPINHFLYIAGDAYTSNYYNRLGVITVVANPADAVYTSLTSRLYNPSTGSQVFAAVYANGKIFIGHNASMEMFTGGSNPVAGTSTDLTSKISGSWTYGDLVCSMAYSSAKATLYLGGSGGSTTKADLVSYQIGYTNNLIGVSTKINSTTNPIATATLTATNDLPTNTSVVYSLSNDGGSTWNTVTSGSPFAFPAMNNSLMWKATLSTTDVSLTPTVTGIAISYTYYNSLTGTMDLKFDAGQNVAWTSLYWNGSAPTNTAMTFKIRTAANQSALDTADWSDTKNASDSPVDLKILNVNGQSGVSDGQWTEIYIDFSTTDGANTPVLQDISADYVINTPPEIQNITASQATDGSKIVNINYQLRDTDTATDANPGKVNISLKYSVDSGAHWSDCTTTTGTGLVDTTTSFADKTATWNVGEDMTNRFYNNTVMIQVIANDSELAHNLATANSSIFSVDTKAPTLGSIGSSTGIQIGDGATWTNSAANNLSLSASDDSTLKMQLRNDTSFTSNDGDFENYAASKTGWALSSGDGNKIVAVRFKDAFGNTTDATANVLLDTTPPGTPGNAAIYDTSEHNLSRYALTIIWDAVPVVGDFQNYTIERSVDSGEYTPLTTTTLTVFTDQSLDNAKTYSYRVKSGDIHNNFSTASNVVTLKPDSKDVTPPTITGGNPNVTPADKTAVVTWNTDKYADSYVQFGKTTSFGSVQGVDTLVESHSVTLVGLDPSTTYYYRVRSKDAAGNIGYSSEDPVAFFTTLADQNPVDKTPPTITSSTPTVTAGFDSTTIGWNTDENANSYVEFGKTASYGTTTGQDELVEAHSVELKNLDPTTTYHYRVKSTDQSGNQAVGADNTFVTLANPNLPDIDPPIITGPDPAATATSSEATITWNTDENADSFVEFGKTTQYGTIQGIDELEQTHSITIKNLASSTEYHYRVRSRDAAGNLKIGNDMTFTTLQASGPGDMTPPKITGPNPGIETTGNTATISWTTDELADSFVEFGKTTSYGFTEGKVEYLASHSIKLIGLDSGTTYHFRVRSTDQNGNLAVGGDQNFTTNITEQNGGKVSINGATAQKPGADPEEVTIIWTTDLYATSQVLYGTTESLDQATIEDATLNKTHYVQLTKLQPNTKYYYQVKSKNANGDITLGELKYFITSQSGLKTPSISGVEVTDITLNSAIVSWQSTVVTTSIVEYGSDLNYGSRIEDLSLGSTTQHLVRFKNLDSGKKYHFRVLGQTSAGDSVSSDDYVFSTLTTPVISAIEVKDIASDKATVTWKTNTETDSFVDLGMDNLDQSQGRSDLVLDHAVTLVGLKPATKYSFKIKSRDKYANQAVSDQLSFSTIVDTIPPQIADLKSETSIVSDTNGTSKAQVIVSWSTNEPASSLVRYSMGTIVGNNYPDSTSEDKNLTTSHVVIISNLAPSATYHLKVVSADGSKNIGSSDDYTVLTQKQDTSLVQYIVQILEDRFFWLKKFGLFE